MASNLEKRIEALEARRHKGKARFVVIEQREDGTWPDAPEEELVVRIQRMGIVFADAPEAGRDTEG